MATAFGGPRLQVKPPERGVFALDHDGECKPLMEKYLTCLRGKQNLHFECRELSKLYLSCRMDKGLMAEENLSKLGLGDVEPGYVRPQVVTTPKRQEEGFVAGTGVNTSNKWLFGMVGKSKS